MTQHGGSSADYIAQGVSQSASLHATDPNHPSMRVPVRNEWRPDGNSIREDWHVAKMSRKDADEKSKLYENRIEMLHKKRERALRMLESTRAQEQKFVEMRAKAEAEAAHQHELAMAHNEQQARSRRDARNMVQSARAGCHIKQVLTQDRNTQCKRQMNEVKAAWKADRIQNDSLDFEYRKGHHDHIHSTHVANPKAAMHNDKQTKLNRTRDHLLYELADHSSVLSAHDSKMDSYVSVEHSMIENVNKVQGDVKDCQDSVMEKFIKHDKSYRVDRIVKNCLKEQPLPPERAHPFTARPG